MFSFGHVFGESSTQEELYSRIGKPAVDGLLLGLNATVVAYGHTGSGKTFSMEVSSQCVQTHAMAHLVWCAQGPSKPSASAGSAGAAGVAPQTSRELHEQRGLIPRALEDCFALVAAANAKIASTPAFLRDKNAVTNVQLVLSAFEVYNSKVQDLLSEFRACYLRP